MSRSTRNHLDHGDGLDLGHHLSNRLRVGGGSDGDGDCLGGRGLYRRCSPRGDGLDHRLDSSGGGVVRSVPRLGWCGPNRDRLLHRLRHCLPLALLLPIVNAQPTQQVFQKALVRYRRPS